MSASPILPDPPFYRSPAHPPSVLELLSRGISDPASTIPAPVYHERALKLSRAGPLVVSHPDAVRAVLLDKGETYGRNRQLRLLMRRAWGDGLAGVEGEPWEHQRRAAAPAFRPQSVEAVVPQMAAAARRGSEGWADGETIDVLPAMALIVTDVIMATLLSGLEDPDLQAIAADMRPVALEVTNFGALDVLPLPERLINRLRGLGRSEEEARLRAVAAKLARLGAPAIDGHRHLPTLLRHAGPLESNMLGFMIAALETTALGAAWALFLLARYPDWQQALRKEASQSSCGSNAGGGLIARQVAQEALRLYPSAPILARAVIKRTTLEGHRLWPGQNVVIPIYAIHRHRLLWDNPDGFDPGRFSPSRDYDRDAYLPFGAGPRLCIAATFALTEIAVILSSLVRLFSFQPAGAEPLVSLKVGTHSLNGLHVTAKRLDARNPRGETLASAEQRSSGCRQ
jgi:cytochrome P450